MTSAQKGRVIKCPKFADRQLVEFAEPPPHARKKNVTVIYLWKLPNKVNKTRKTIGTDNISAFKPTEADRGLNRWAQRRLRIPSRNSLPQLHRHLTLHFIKRTEIAKPVKNGALRSLVDGVQQAAARAMCRNSQ